MSTKGSVGFPQGDFPGVLREPVGKYLSGSLLRGREVFKFLRRPWM